MTFLELELVKGGEFFIHPASIVEIWPAEQGCTIVSMSGNDYHVNEDATTLAYIIDFALVEPDYELEDEDDEDELELPLDTGPDSE